MSAPSGTSGLWIARADITWLASAWTLARRPRTNGLPIKRKSTSQRIGCTTMSSNHAMEDDGRRLLGTVPSATILMVNSTRYKLKGAHAIAFTDTTSRIRGTTISTEAGNMPHLQRVILGRLWVLGC